MVYLIRLNPYCPPFSSFVNEPLRPYVVSFDEASFVISLHVVFIKSFKQKVVLLIATKK